MARPIDIESGAFLRNAPSTGEEHDSAYFDHR